MENAQRALMIGVGLFITIIIISAILLITNLGTGLINDARSELGNLSTALQSQLLDAYDGKTISGSELLAALRQYATSTTVSVSVYNSGSGGNGQFFIGAGVLDVPGYTDKNKYVVGGISNCRIIESTTHLYTSRYSEFASRISLTRYYRTAVCYDSNGKLLGFAAIRL